MAQEVNEIIISALGVFQQMSAANGGISQALDMSRRGFYTCTILGIAEVLVHKGL